MPSAPMVVLAPAGVYSTKQQRHKVIIINQANVSVGCASSASRALSRDTAAAICAAVIAAARPGLGETSFVTAPLNPVAVFTATHEAQRIFGTVNRPPRTQTPSMTVTTASAVGAVMRMTGKPGTTTIAALNFALRRSPIFIRKPATSQDPIAG